MTQAYIFSIKPVLSDPGIQHRHTGKEDRKTRTPVVPSRGTLPTYACGMAETQSSPGSIAANMCMIVYLMMLAGINIIKLINDRRTVHGTMIKVPRVS